MAEIYRINERVKEFFLQYPRLSFPKNTILIRPDEDPAGICYIEEGFIKQYSISVKGELLMLTVYKPGAFIPLTWGLNETPNKSTYESLTDVVIYKAPPQEVVSFLKTNPDILFDKTQRLLLGISGLLDRMETLVLDSASVRVARVLWYFGKSFGEKKGEFVRLPFAIPHKEIAAWTGLARETVSLQIESFIKAGAINYDGRIIEFVNLEKLKKDLI